MMRMMLLHRAPTHDRHHRRRRWHRSLAVDHGLNLMLRHARRQQALAHLLAQLGLGFFFLLFLLGLLLGLLDVPALHGLGVGLFAGGLGSLLGLLLFELRERVFLDDAVALGAFFFVFVDYEEEVGG